MKKVFYFVVVIMTFFLGVIGTLIVMEDRFIVEKTVEKTIVNDDSSINESVDLVYDAVVMIESYNKGSLTGTGTGFVYKKDDTNGYIITNHHVIENATEVKVVYINGNRVEAKVLGSDSFADLAVLSVSSSSVIKVANIGDSTESKLGDILFTVGSPLGEEYMGTVTKGILSGKDRMVEVDSTDGDFIMKVLQTDAAINPGNSGGPLVNLKGEVIGVNSLKLVKDEVEGMGFAIPIETAMESVKLLEKGEVIKRPALGISIISSTDKYSLLLNRIYLDKDFEYGVVIVSVDQSKVAGKAGLKAKDVILEIDGQKITSISQFRYILFNYHIGDTISVKYYSGSEEKTVNITLTDTY